MSPTRSRSWKPPRPRRRRGPLQAPPKPRLKPQNSRRRSHRRTERTLCWIRRKSLRHLFPWRRKVKIPPTCLPARAPWMFIFTFPLSCAASGANVSCCLSERMIMCSGAPRLARQQKVVRTQGQGRDVATSSIRREGVWCGCWAVCCWRLLRAASTQLSTGDAQNSLKQVPVGTLSWTFFFFNIWILMKQHCHDRAVPDGLYLRWLIYMLLVTSGHIQLCSTAKHALLSCSVFA